MITQQSIMVFHFCIDINVLIFRTVVTYWICEWLGQNSNKTNSDLPVWSAAFEPRQCCYCLFLISFISSGVDCQCQSLWWPYETEFIWPSPPTDNIINFVTSPQKHAVSHLWRDDNLADIFTACPHDIFSHWLLPVLLVVAQTKQNNTS